eukprot:7378131-Prymnesium_polylepis.2
MEALAKAVNVNVVSGVSGLKAVNGVSVVSAAIECGEYGGCGERGRECDRVNAVSRHVRNGTSGITGSSSPIALPRRAGAMLWRVDTSIAGAKNTQDARVAPRQGTRVRWWGPCHGSVSRDGAHGPMLTARRPSCLSLSIPTGVARAVERHRQYARLLRRRWHPPPLPLAARPQPAHMTVDSHSTVCKRARFGGGEVSFARVLFTPYPVHIGVRDIGIQARAGSGRGRRGTSGSDLGESAQAAVRTGTSNPRAVEQVYDVQSRSRRASLLAPRTLCRSAS